MKHVDPDQVSLFRVPLPCGFAPKIGCGSLARPLLVALERTPGITEAWLNHEGTLLAVVGSKTFTDERRAQVVKATLEADDILSEELRGQERLPYSKTSSSAPIGCAGPTSINSAAAKQASSPRVL